MVSILPILVIFFTAQKYFIQGIAMTGSTMIDIGFLGR